MKEFEQLSPKIEAHEKEKKKSEIRFVGSLKKPHKGMKLFSFNSNSFELKEAVIIKSIKYVRGEAIKTNKVEKQKDCVYFYALNKKSALKKLKKFGIDVGTN